MTPSYANLFLGYFKANALENAPFQPHTLLPYIDAIFMIWTKGLDNFSLLADVSHDEAKWTRGERPLPAFGELFQEAADQISGRNLLVFKTSSI